MELLSADALADLLRKDEYAPLRALHAADATSKLHEELKKLGIAKMGARAKVIVALGKLQADDAEGLKQNRHQDPCRSGMASGRLRRRWILQRQCRLQKWRIL